MLKPSLSHKSLAIISHRTFPSLSLITNTRTLFSPAQSIRRYLFSLETESHAPTIFIEQEDKKASSALCPLRPKWPEERLMKWSKLLWLSSLFPGCRRGEEPEKARPT